jgi:CRISPR-associated protein Csd1
MLLQALAHYADTDLADDLADEAFEMKPVPYGVQIDDQGRFSGISVFIDEKQVEGAKKPKTFKVTREMLIPKSPVNRNSGVYPLLGADAIQYVVGPEPGVWTKPGDAAKHEKHHAAFIELVREAAELTQDSWLRAAALFYGNPAEVAKAREALAAEKPKGGANAVLVFSPGPDSEIPSTPIVKSPAVKEFWRRRFHDLSGERHAKGGEGVCMISGKRGPIAVTHDTIKGTSKLGGRAEVRLMSFDKQAFRSYGWEQNQNSPVSPERATAYVLALNDLLKPGRHRQGRDRDSLIRTRSDFGGMGFLYWTRDPEDIDVVSCIDFGPDADMAVADMLNAPWTGKPVDGVNPNWFYLLTVSGNGGRLVVHDWHAEALADVQRNIRAWRETLQVPDIFRQGQPAPVPSVYRLVHAIMTPGMKDDNKQAGHWKLAMVRRALFGPSRFPFGIAILAAALDRMRHVQGSERLSPVRAGLIRLCVNDLIRMKSEGETILNENLANNLDHPAAICGRLMAVYESLQYQAQGDVGQTVGDRYFAMASTYPQLAFPRLETLSRAHLKKLRRDKPAAFVTISRLLNELTEKFAAHGAQYPVQLSIEGQGRFAIGYHCQRAEDSRRIQEAKERKDAGKNEAKAEA